MTTKHCNVCKRLAFATDGKTLYINGKPLEFPGKKAQAHWQCLTKDCKGWLHWEKKQ